MVARLAKGDALAKDVFAPSLVVDEAAAIIAWCVRGQRDRRRGKVLIGPRETFEVAVVKDHMFDSLGWAVGLWRVRRVDGWKRLVVLVCDTRVRQAGGNLERDRFE